MAEDDAKPAPAEVPQQAMLDYLDALLQGATELDFPEPAPPRAPVAPAVEPGFREALAETVAEAPADVVGKPASEPLPDWAARDFEVLLFDVSGLMLAVPLVELGGILRAPAELDIVPGQPGWMLGVLQANGETLSVVDTLRWLAPERVDRVPPEPPRYLVRLPDSNWVLSCRKLFEAVTLRSADVHWRDRRTRRRWLRGTVREHMCALLDTPTLAGLLDEAAAGRTSGRG